MLPAPRRKPHGDGCLNFCCAPPADGHGVRAGTFFLSCLPSHPQRATEQEAISQLLGDLLALPPNRLASRSRGSCPISTKVLFHGQRMIHLPSVTSPPPRFPSGGLYRTSPDFSSPSLTRDAANDRATVILALPFSRRSFIPADGDVPFITFGAFPPTKRLGLGLRKTDFSPLLGFFLC